MRVNLQRRCVLPILWLAICFNGQASASLGDRQPEFKTCVAACVETNCGPNGLSIPLHRRLLLWTCPSECDYACQHITTTHRLARDPPHLFPILQYHGKWPFHRFLGMQEPASVLFSLCNFLAHLSGLERLKRDIPASYSLRKWYLGFGYMGLLSWAASMLFHTRDFTWTERVDYYAAGGSVMYGLYLAPIRVFRLDRKPATLLRLWTALCASLYTLHLAYLTLVRFDYTYNMLANIIIGVLQNLLWTLFSIRRYRRVGRVWAAWPGLIVAWIVLAMSLELFDFAPWRGMVDAHSLWHLGTVGPTVWWYSFLVKDAREELLGVRLKA
ncbi:hypothetical protein LTR08_009302 [Meristemomyces frigidus]|nr:hypothetical protein LTR08_009302 [Meristemomyces frigidus]